MRVTRPITEVQNALRDQFIARLEDLLSEYNGINRQGEPVFAELQCLYEGDSLFVTIPESYIGDQRVREGVTFELPAYYDGDIRFR